MDTQLVMTILGPDRPGVVESVAKVISEHGGNWLESRMARLAGQFAGILRVAIAPEHADPMRDALSGLEQVGLIVIIKHSAEEEADRAMRQMRLELAGSDHPGIVHQLTEVIASHGVNIEELLTEVVASPMTGSPMFKASAALRVPGGVDVSELSSALEAVAADLMVDIALAQENP